MEENDMFQSRIDLSDISLAHNQMLESIGKVVVGQNKLISYLLVAILTEGHVLLEGLPGVAKTLLAKSMAKSVDTSFGRIQFTPDLMPGDVTGTMMYNLKDGKFSFKKGPIFANIVLIDEINRAPAKTQAALFECMEEQQVTIDGTSHALEAPFMVIGTQNPIDQEGTYRLPEAQLDRFLFKLQIDYPQLEEEVEIIMRHQRSKHETPMTDAIRPSLTPEHISRIKTQIDDIIVKPELIAYIAAIVIQTRNTPHIFVGASPRASISLLKSAKAWAAIQGRDFVVPEDIKEMCYPVLNHRVTLTPEKEMEGVSVKTVIESLLEQVPVPN